jgi:hypothetical protein
VKLLFGQYNPINDHGWSLRGFNVHWVKKIKKNKNNNNNNNNN